MLFVLFVDLHSKAEICAQLSFIFVLHNFTFKFKCIKNHCKNTLVHVSYLGNAQNGIVTLSLMNFILTFTAENL